MYRLLDNDKRKSFCESVLPSHSLRAPAMYYLLEGNASSPPLPLLLILHGRKRFLGLMAHLAFAQVFSPWCSLAKCLNGLPHFVQASQARLLYWEIPAHEIDEHAAATWQQLPQPLCSICPFMIAQVMFSSFSCSCFHYLQQVLEKVRNRVQSYCALMPAQCSGMYLRGGHGVVRAMDTVSIAGANSPQPPHLAPKCFPPLSLGKLPTFNR